MYKPLSGIIAHRGYDWQNEKKLNISIEILKNMIIFAISFQIYANMRLDGRRQSDNIEDRRGMSTGAKAGIGGIGGIIVVVLLTLMSGGSLTGERADRVFGGGTTVRGVLQDGACRYRGCMDGAVPETRTEV